MKRVRLPLALAVLLASVPFAGDRADLTRRAPFPSPRMSRTGKLAFTSSNVNLMGWKTLADFPGGNTSGNDIWGYTSGSGREYAVIGLDGGTGFVEVTDPGNPVIVDFEPHNSSPSLWRCIKVYGAFAYAGSEAGGGIQIFDMTNIDSGVVTASDVTGSSCTTATHTLALDEVSGFLYRAGGGGTCGGVYQGLQIYALTAAGHPSASPGNPVLVGQWNTGRYVHECQVVKWTIAGIYNGKQIAFCCTETSSGGGDPRLQILDVTNKAAITQISSTAYTSGQFSHQGWLTPNRLHFYLNDELDDQNLGIFSLTRVFNVTNLAAPTVPATFSSGTTSIDHNLYTKGNRIYESNYRSGLRVFDNTSPTAPVQTGFFDTWPSDDLTLFNSLWSNYPYFASGTIIGGDIESGLWVWREGAPKLTFDFPGGVPELLPPTGGTVQFTVDESTLGVLVGGTVKVHYSTGGPFTNLTATSLGGDLYQVTLPSIACQTEVDFYLSARSTGNVTWTDPPAAPTQVHIARAAYGDTLVFEDTLETITGWVVNGVGDTATGGAWVQANPNGTAANPEDDHTGSPGTMCWFTGQGTLGGPLGEADVDGGVTTLRSPILDASGLDNPHLSYWRWYSNQTNDVIDDQFVIDISDNGGASWINLETLGPTGVDTYGGWIKHTARISQFVAPTNNLRLRFRARDAGSGSIVEAAIDDLRIFELDCDPPSVTATSINPPSGPFAGGQLVTITGTGFFAGVTTVTFNGTPATAVNVFSSTGLVARVPAMALPGSGKMRQGSIPVDVVVSNPGSDTLPAAYTYVKPLP